MNTYPFIHGQRPGALVWVPGYDGKVLFQFRDENPRVAPLQFSLWGGAIEEGESPELATSRELFEELGMQTAINPFSDMHKMMVTSQYGDVPSYLCELSRPVSWSNFRVYEGAGAAFFTLSEVRALEAAGILAPIASLWVEYMASKQLFS